MFLQELHLYSITPLNTPENIKGQFSHIRKYGMVQVSIFSSPFTTAMEREDLDRATKMTPEQEIALGVLIRNFPRWKARFQGTRLASESVDEDDIGFFQGHLSSKDLQHEPAWFWNQTKARRKYQLPGTEDSVLFWKLIPRRMKGNLHAEAELPVHRVWLYQITTTSFGEVSAITMVWCQEGLVDVLAPVLSTIPSDTHLEEFTGVGSSRDVPDGT